MSASTLRKNRLVEDPRQRIARLVNSAAPRLRRAFLRSVDRVRSRFTLNQIADLLERGRIDELLRLTQNISESIAEESSSSFMAAAIATALFLTNKGTQFPVSFDITDPDTLAIIQNNRARLVRYFSEEQSVATRSMIAEGMARGSSYKQQAKAFRDSVGLTEKQLQAVANYKRLLEQSSKQALRRQLRDKQFDPTVTRAASGGDPLTSKQIDMMVERYRQSYLTYRANLIARTEALGLVSEAVEDSYRQAYQAGSISDVISSWNTRRDNRVRRSHTVMEGQKVAYGESFVSGNGNLLRFPGDPNAPLSDIAGCRCWLTREISIPLA